MKMFYRVILLRIYEDGRISNQTSIHPTEDNACHYAKGALLTGSADGFAVIEECKDDWNVVLQHLDVTHYCVTLRNDMFRIERAQQPVSV
ncbi:hypothetical protein SCRM01_232 [Synechococcus phage S-CRM01]|uniref:hypothetical protein n=1 Tax=Synechococcus phage S-CRM01 TaxID=1026955 RepID=UPI000209E439|nr:hypothetical protein SCRM01_232 [Synechococcus phage S-CRM01]AEC53178.1 hypothetical protein SCRM01_232 [Synechococcus phage S-CRM01]